VKSPRVKLRWPPTTTAIALASAVAVYAVLVWDRRWIADDGLIVVRTARQILEGNGPVYSAFERAEASTSTLWTWLLAAVAAVTRANVAQLAVALGGLLAVGGFAAALDASRRLARGAGRTGLLVPAGALVVLAVFPFWDYGTSGLETGLSLGWLGAIWWLLVELRADAVPRRLAVFAVVVGLGPLVRPDFALVSSVFLGAAWWIVRPRWRRTLWLAGAAIALPLAYLVFRAGYYGTLVPLPALAKSATGSEWARGFAYLMKYVRPHLLYVPIAVLAVVAVLDRRAIVGRDRIVMAAPVVAGLVLAVFVTRVGGDFMHGRLLVPSTILIVMPVLVLPIRRASVVALAVLGAWALFTGIRFYTGARRVSGDERAGYAAYTKQRNPTRDADYIAALPGVADGVATALRDGKRILITEAGTSFPMSDAHDVAVVIAVGRLGVGGAIAPLDAIAVDVFGLANPLGARITRTSAGATGHEKELPWAWVLADFADPSVTAGAVPEEIEAARRAMRCGELAELLASVREPLTASRFWANLTGAWRRTRLVIPSDPIAAAAQFCR
jgi:arabinofuranosyltransferase